MGRIPVASPQINPEMVDYVADAAAHAWYENANMYHERFEKMFSNILAKIRDGSAVLHFCNPLDTEVFSFHGSKTMTAGERGMLVTNREDLYQRCFASRDHGRAPGEKMFWNAKVGYKHKMSSIQAALGLAQMERIDELVGRKRQIFSWYQENPKSIGGIMLNCESSETKNSYWMVTAFFDPKFGFLNEDIIQMLTEKGIDSRPFFYPLSFQPAYTTPTHAHKAQIKNNVVYRISPYGINLPCRLNMDEKKGELVCNAVKQVLKRE
jgi:perosamine synthetase